MDVIARKKEIVTHRLNRRDEERLASVKEKRLEKEAVVAITETEAFFRENFDKSKDEIEKAIEKSDSVDRSKLVEHFDEISLLIQALQKFVADSSVFLIPRDIQNSQRCVQDLQAQVQSKRDVLLPKKKFAFKSKRKETAASEDATESKTQNPTTKKLLDIEVVDCNFKDRQDEMLTMTPEEVTNKDVALSNLSNCTVKLFGSPGAVHIDRLVNCTVLVGPVSGSIFADQCHNCSFALACQQLRIHNTKDSDFYVHVTSKAIIEDCLGVRFAPFNLSYAQLDAHFQASALSRNVNNWDAVDDFDWLAADSKSPHWCEIPEKERVLFQN